ncbi:hypothetical protein BYT27DRAFT_7075067, partial [Phlegmacium glaucopus]
DYLAIQGSAVPCKRVFPSVKETMISCWNHINEDLMEMLQMLKFSMKLGRSLDFSEGTSQEDIISFLESALNAESDVLEDIHGYIQSLLSTVE